MDFESRIRPKIVRFADAKSAAHATGLIVGNELKELR